MKTPNDKLRKKPEQGYEGEIWKEKTESLFIITIIELFWYYDVSWLTLIIPLSYHLLPEGHIDGIRYPHSADVYKSLLVGQH